MYSKYPKEERKAEKKLLSESRGHAEVEFIFSVGFSDERGSICIHRNGLLGAMGSVSTKYCHVARKI